MSGVKSSGEWVVAFMVFAVWAIFLCCDTAPIDATPEARRWADDMGYAVKGVACAGRDSDYDGYVSCSVNIGEGEPLAVECNYRFGGGCKVTDQVKVRTRSN